jgi:transcriptional regulator of acetoin/glycerol metabolism
LEAALEALLRHDWPGNVRELKNVIQRASLLARDELLEPSDFGLPDSPGARAPDDEPDRAAIEAALAGAGGVISQAAAGLGLSRQALYRRMDKLGIPRE